MFAVYSATADSDISHLRILSLVFCLFGNFPTLNLGNMFPPLSLVLATALSLLTLSLFHSWFGF